MTDVTPAAPSTLAIGDTVQFKSGGQKMTVSGIGGAENAPTARKNWFERDHVADPVVTASGANTECIWMESVGIVHIIAVSDAVVNKIPPA